MGFVTSTIWPSLTQQPLRLLIRMHKDHRVACCRDLQLFVWAIDVLVNLFIGSSSAKWALLGPIFVPMLMQLNISPDLTQAAYRLGDSSSNIITPLMPYFPLVVVYCQRYVKSTGIGTLLSLMLPFSVSIILLWTLFLLAYWGLGIPLGIQASYIYPAAG